MAVSAKPNRWKSIWPGLLLCALALAVTAVLCVPLRTFGANSGEFQHGFADSWPQLLALAAIVFAASFLLGFLAPLRASALWLALALCVWIQSSFLVWDYGVFDGKGIQWERYGWQGVVDLAVWALVVGVLQWRAQRLRRQLGWIAGAFLVLQLASTWIELRSSGAEPFARVEHASDDDFQRITRLSEGRNVVHVLMDAFQTDVFLDVVREDGLEDAFAGFTVFRDNLSSCAWTQLSLPSIFGGEVYDGSVTTSEFIQNAITERAFFNQLQDQGYAIDLIPFLAMEEARHDNYYTSPRVYGKSQREQALDEQRLLLDVSFFRLAPHRLRRWIHNDGNWRISRIGDAPTTRSFHQKAFLTDFTAALRLEGEQPRYHFLHLFPPHLPYVTNEDGSYAGHSLPNTWENFKTEARWILRGSADLMRRLQELGVYDDALVIVQGDHGSTHAPRFDGTPTPIRRDGYAGLLAIKLPGAGGGLTVSDAPTMHADIPATVMKGLGLPSTYPGPSAFELEAGVARSRRFVEPHWEDNELESFSVDGSAHDPAAWTSLGRRRIGERASDYRWGDAIVFSMDGNAGLYLDRGWSYPDEGFIWNSGTRANLRIAIEQPPSDVHLYIALRPFLVPGRKDEQRVGVVVNGEGLVEWRLQGQPPLLHVTIPQRLLTGPELDLALVTPDAATPRSIGVGNDDRQLAISVREMRMTLQPLERR